MQTSGTPTLSENGSCAPGKIGLEDRATDHFGGEIYSTGASDIMVTILNPLSPLLIPPTSASVGVWDAISTIPRLKHRCIKIKLKHPRPERYIGKMSQYGATINLGKLPPGEIKFEIIAGDYTFVTGDATNNPDKLVHAVVRTYTVQTKTSGRMQVWFEDAPGPLKGWGESDRNFTGVALELTGGVSDSNAVADLLKVIKEQKDPVRQAAIDSLKKICPLAAANAGF